MVRSMRNRGIAAIAVISLLLSGCGHKAGGVDIWNAVKQGDVADIGKFAAAGGDLDIQHFKGYTPLWQALFDKNRDSYEALLINGADPDVIVSDQFIVTHWAAAQHDLWWLQITLDLKPVYRDWLIW